MSQPLPNKNLPMPSLRNIQAFIEVAATGSLNLAAENLNITASAVSHQIASLEHFLGKKLFSRSSKGVTLTAVGEKYLKEVSGALNMIGQATSQVINDIHQDYLRIHSAPSFGLLWLMPRLDKFRQAWPALKISLTCSYESIQFSRDNIDIDIRHGLSQWPTLLVRTIKNERVLPYSAASYLASHPVQAVEDLLACDLIHSDSTLINWSNWLSWHKVRGWHKNFIFNFFSTAIISDHSDSINILFIFRIAFYHHFSPEFIWTIRDNQISISSHHHGLAFHRSYKFLF